MPAAQRFSFFLSADVFLLLRTLRWSPNKVACASSGSGGSRQTGPYKRTAESPPAQKSNEISRSDTTKTWKELKKSFDVETPVGLYISKKGARC
jgi:hypothetical protein